MMPHLAMVSESHSTCPLGDSTGPLFKTLKYILSKCIPRHLFLPFIQHTFIKLLPCARHCTRGYGYKNKGTWYLLTKNLQIAENINKSTSH